MDARPAELETQALLRRRSYQSPAERAALSDGHPVDQKKLRPYLARYPCQLGPLTVMIWL